MASTEDNTGAKPLASNASMDLSMRPMAGIDLNNFRGRFSLHMADAIYALSIQNSAAFNKMGKSQALSYDIEMLIRLYYKHPGPAPWLYVTPRRGFELLYGPLMAVFEGTPYEREARLALQNRYVVVMGRSTFTGYRWMDKAGNAKLQVGRTLAKLTEIPNPRDVIEEIAKVMLRVRGRDLDMEVPLPDINNPPLPKRRGPPRRNPELLDEGVVLSAAAAGKPVKRAAAKKAAVKAAAAKGGATKPAASKAASGGAAVKTAVKPARKKAAA